MKFFIIILLLSFHAISWAQGSLLVIDTANHKVIHEQNANMVRPIASITKLMTAIVSLDLYNLNDKINLSKKQAVTVKELLIRLLVRSDNHAAEILAKNHPQGRNAFLQAMNNKAQNFNLKTTNFNDPSGLRSDNTSTALEVAVLAMEASKYDFIRQVSAVPTVKNYSNTNFNLLKDFPNVLVSKTGFTTAAGRCLALLMDFKNSQYAIIILGEPTKNSRENTARNLIHIGSINTVDAN